MVVVATQRSLDQTSVFGTDGLIHKMEHGENDKEIHMYIYLLI